ncbi:MAG TPA: hypothetical protein VNY36_01995 [Bacteroidia bacterium]|nr:hypothetical protein [Bacteroidia bacterium]
MRKKTILKLSIPTPCHENWDNMSPNEKGRHCQSCNKTVVDFSQYTDKQLIDFFLKVKDNICGRISKFQLERQLVYVEPSKHPFFNKLLYGTALAAGLSTVANAQQNATTPQPTKKLSHKQKRIAKKADAIQAIPPQNIEEIPMITEEAQTKPISNNEPENMPGMMVGGMICIAIPGFTSTDLSTTVGPEALLEKQVMDQIHQGGTNEMSLKPHAAAAPKSRDGGGGL